MPTKTSARRGGWTPVGDTAGGTRSKATRTIPGEGQAKALNTAVHGLPDVPSRTALLRLIVTWGLERPVTEVRAQEPVPATHDSAPSEDKQMTWIPLARQLDRLDAQAKRVGCNRNELMRKHIAAWLAGNT